MIDSRNSRSGPWIFRLLVAATATVGFVGVLHTLQVTHRVFRNDGGELVMVDNNRRGEQTLEEAAKPVLAKSDWILPSDSQFTMNFLTLGDFGATLVWQGSPVPAGFTDCVPGLKGWGSRVNQKQPYASCGTPEWWKQWHAQKNIAYLMGLSAAKLKPVAVLGQGDNFYWDGVANPNSQLFKAVFEDIYSHPALNIPFLQCLGNHDIGGSAYICGNDPGTLNMNDLWHTECSSGADIKDALMRYYNANRDYKGSGRWVFNGNYYLKTFTAGGVSVDVYTVDTNAASVHGVIETCCQCYGYGAKINMVCDKKGGAISKANDCDICKNAHRGLTYVDAVDGATKPVCAPEPIYDACYDTIMGWFNDAMSQLKAALATSQATWKIVNTHYSPLIHFATADPPYKTVMDSIGNDVHVWINGHTHSAAHEYHPGIGTHFIMDGSGGGITAEAAGPPLAETGAGRIWALGNVYAFTELSLSKQWLKVNFVSFANDWAFTPDGGSGSPASIHCWLIPVDGGQGVSCEGARSWTPPAPTTAPPPGAATPANTPGSSSSTSNGASSSVSGSSTSSPGSSQNSASSATKEVSTPKSSATSDQEPSKSSAVAAASKVSLSFYICALLAGLIVILS